MNRAIVIGCREYNDVGIASLHFADMDAQAVAGVFHTSCGVPSSDMVTLPSVGAPANPTRNAIIRALTPPEGTRSNKQPDKLFFFFSGHGFHSNADDQDYLMPCDAVVQALEETSIRLDTVLSLLKRWNPKNIVLFLDLCRAATRGGKSVEAVLWRPVKAAALRASGVAVFWSCSPGKGRSRRLALVAEFSRLR